MPRFWPDGTPVKTDVIRVYRIEHDVPGFASVVASQPESGTVMARAEHLEAIRQGKPWLAHEYKGGNMQLELPVKGMRKVYNIEVVERVNGAELNVSVEGTKFPPDR